MSRSAYSRGKCHYCDARLSSSGFAQYQHNMKHVREGVLARVRHVETGDERFLTIGEFERVAMWYEIPGHLIKYHSVRALEIDGSVAS